MKIPADIINERLLTEIEKMKPFGIGNEQPLFVSEDFGLVNVDVIGKDRNHLKLSLYDGNKYYKAIYFGGVEREKDLKTGEKIDLVYTLKKNEYNGNKYIDLVVRDFRKV
jgi:single-stranded-DNA-specific exonuclease